MWPVMIFTIFLLLIIFLCFIIENTDMYVFVPGFIWMLISLQIVYFGSIWYKNKLMNKKMK